MKTKPRMLAPINAMIKSYIDGMEISFHPCHENTTADATIAVTVTDVPKWVSSRLVVGQEFSMQNIDGVLHWYIDGVEVTEPQSPDPAQL